MNAVTSRRALHGERRRGPPPTKIERISQPSRQNGALGRQRGDTVRERPEEHRPRDAAAVSSLDRHTEAGADAVDLVVDRQSDAAALEASGSTRRSELWATSRAIVTRRPRFGPDADARQPRRVENKLLAVLAVDDDADRHQPLAVGVELMRQRDGLRQRSSATRTTSSAPTWVAAALVRHVLAAA